MVKMCPECECEFTTNRSSRIYCSKACSNRFITRGREEAKADIPKATVWSCGGGVQSTAIAVLIAQGKLPKPDYALMSDSGYETQITMDYVHRILVPKMADVGVNLQILKTTEWSNNDIISNGHVNIPAYKDNTKFRTHCNETWKVRVTKRYLRSQGVERAENWIGISTDEAKRQRPGLKKWLTHRYPLIEMGMSREDCLWLICSAGWPKPPRTSCLICPNQDDQSWSDLKATSPVDWQRAVTIERQIQSVCPGVYLHRSLVPLAEAKLRH